MSLSLAVQEMRIERVIRRGSRMVEAEFFRVTPDGPWLACTAWIVHADSDKPHIQGRNTCMSPEQAHVEMAAIQMAITWIFEEKQKLATGGGE